MPAISLFPTKQEQTLALHIQHFHIYIQLNLLDTVTKCQTLSENVL